MPFVGGQGPGEGRIARGDEGVIVEIRECAVRLRKFRVVVVDHERLHLGERKGLPHHGGELAVADHDLGFRVISWNAMIAASSRVFIESSTAPVMGTP